MSHLEDLKDLKDIDGLHSCPDHEVIDFVLDSISKEAIEEKQKTILSKGRLVHKIVLTNNNVPARVESAELNLILERDVYVGDYNELRGCNFDLPGSWLVRKGFTVRSKKVNGYWVQYAFTCRGPSNLTQSEIEEYCSIANLRECSELCVRV